MEFLLIRHGKAEAHGHPEGDAARGLIEKGHRQAERVGKFLVAHDLVPDLVLTSPLRRARETAEGFCTSAGIDPPVVQEWLHAMYPENSLQELAVYSGTCSRVAIVGHEPSFSDLVGYILGLEDGCVRVKKASVILMTIDPPRRGGTLHFNVWPTMF